MKTGKGVLNIDADSVRSFHHSMNDFLNVSVQRFISAVTKLLFNVIRYKQKYLVEILLCLMCCKYMFPYISCTYYIHILLFPPKSNT